MRATLDALRSARGADDVTVIDLGASYGVNAELLGCDVTLDILYERYGDPALADLERDDLLERDRACFREHDRERHIETVGIDPAGNAIANGMEVELLDHGITTNLEEESLEGPDAATLRGADLVMSTG